MSRKGQKPSAKGSHKKGDDDDRENPLQAVVLADSFETRFSPFTLERPRCLLPLANTPLIEYTFEFLANAGVEEVFVYCGAHTDQVEEYIRTSKWSNPASTFSKLDIIRSTSRSTGDAMRDLDSRDIITGDFLLVSGDVVSNLPLEPALAKHRARRAADKNAIMTMVLREAGSTHRSKAQAVRPVFVVDPTKDRCVHYEEMHPRQTSHFINIDPDLLTSHSQLEVRNDLIDCSIDICTPDVLALWTDSFDYESPRKHFLYGVLKDYELNGKTIHTHVISNHYAARVRDLPAYDAVSKDIVSRWSFPLCPDSNLLQGQSYRLQRGNIYQEDGVTLAQSCVVQRRTVIGRDTSIGEGSVVGDSIIGRGCRIGKNVTIDASYIWDDVVIGDGTNVRQAVVANGSKIGSNCDVQPGALLSYTAVIDDGSTVKGIVLASGKERPTELSRGAESDDEDDDAEDDITSAGLLYNMTDLAISDDSISTLDSDDMSDIPMTRHSAAGSFTTIMSEGSVEDEFHRDAAASIFEALQRGEDPDIIQLELQGLRMGEDADYHRVRRAVVTAFMKRAQQVMDTQSVGPEDAVSQVLRNYQVVFEKTIFDKGKETKTDQVDLLLSLQRDLMRRSRGESMLLVAAKTLYWMDVLEEDGFNQWWQDARSRADGELLRVRSQTQQFMDWLANAEEDSDEEGDDGDDDDAS